MELMKIIFKKYIIFFTFCLISVGYLQHGFAQNIKTVDVSQIKFLYDELRFEEAIGFGQEVLKKDKISTPQHLEYIHQYLAYSFFNTGLLDSARVHFLALISINPEAELDPINTSPKIIDFFNQTKINSQEIYGSLKVIEYPKYVFIEDIRPAAAWRSAILPGWGQYYKGQNTRAYILGSAFISSAVILGVSLVNENKYKDSYLNSTDPVEISTLYDKYNNWSKVRQVSTYTTIGIWLLSFADALWSDYPRFELEISGYNLEITSISLNFPFL